MNRRGFTLVEILIVVAFLAIIFGFSIVAVNRAKKTLFAQEQIEVVQIINEAAVRSRSGVNTTNWGVAFFPDPTTGVLSNMVLFSGDDYATRDITEDLEYTGGTVLVNAMSFSNLGSYTGAGYEIIFEKYSGEPHQSGYIEIINGDKTSRVDIHSSGIPVLTK